MNNQPLNIKNPSSYQKEGFKNAIIAEFLRKLLYFNLDL